MNHELLAILEYIEQERGVSKDQLAAAVEDALLAASHKGIHPAKELKVKMDRTTGDIRAWAHLEVVDSNPNDDQLLLSEALKRCPNAKIGDFLDWEVTPKNFGRIAAQTAKQAILQKIRDAEKAIVSDEFSNKVGEIVNGTVRRYDAGSIIVDMQKAEGVLGPKDKIPGEQYMPGERINAILLSVDTKVSGPSLILSRSSVKFIRKLFEREVSEIHDGVVEIVGIARDAGNRTKLAVKSEDPRVDPVGACVGMRGMRVKNITNELGGERVDIIEYSDDIAEYAANALHPARAEKIVVDRENSTVFFYVDEENSRLAFGKKAQNVKLAQKLIQWKIEIRMNEEQPQEEEGEMPSKEEFEEKKKAATEELSSVLGVSIETAEKLVGKGFLTVEGLRAAPASEYENLGIAPEEIRSIMEKVSQENGTAQQE